MELAGVSLHRDLMVPRHQYHPHHRHLQAPHQLQVEEAEGQFLHPGEAKGVQPEILNLWPLATLMLLRVHRQFLLAKVPQAAILLLAACLVRLEEV
jgi:hypothetical protein